jgi:hypothetical protein
MTAEIEGFEPNMDGDFEFTRADLDAAIETARSVGFSQAAEIAIKFAEELAPGRNGGKRMREHFEAIRAKAKV